MKCSRNQISHSRFDGESSENVDQINNDDARLEADHCVECGFKSLQ